MSKIGKLSTKIFLTTVIIGLSLLLIQTGSAQSSSLTGSSTQALSFKQASDAAGISLDYLARQTALSRYDLTRLLNAVECQDCLNPSPLLLDKYTDIFRSSFVTLPGEDFRDILYRQSFYNQQSYYYCVATVADRDYMNGFPLLTSPTCSGNFCGSKSVTKAEFFQTVINILKKYIAKEYTTNRSEIQNRYSGLQTGDYARLMFTSKDTRILSESLGSCQTDDCSLSSSEQFDVYMKYCTFNLDACQMEEFGILPAGYWPVAEMNIALNQGLIADDAVSNSLHQAVDPSYAIDILAKFFPRVACSFDRDYDCDGITNQRDNCPTDYNPNQSDKDQDKVGDVCDGDIDGDGITNPLHIVDARGAVNSSLLTPTTDNCLFVANKDQKDSNDNLQGDSCDMTALSSLFIKSSVIGTGNNRQLLAEALYAGDKKALQWTLEGGGQKAQTSGPFIRQRIGSGGIYTIQVRAADTRIYASHQVIIADYNPRAQATIQTVIEKDFLPVVIQSRLISSGPGSRILWTLSGPENSTKESVTANERVSFLLRLPGLYTLTALLREGTITTAVAEQQIAVSTAQTILGQSVASPVTIRSDTPLQYRLTINTGRIDTIAIDRGDGQTQSSRSLTNSHSYTNPGSYVIRNSINLLDGGTLRESHTILVEERGQTPENTDKYLTLTPDPLRSIAGVGTQRSVERKGYSDTEDIQRRFFFDGLRILSGLASTVYTTPGMVYPSLTEIFGQCQTTTSQGSYIIDDSRALVCLEYSRRGSKPICDMDNDGIDDICDDDIDGDGVKNAIGVITKHLSGCAISTENVNPTLYTDHFIGSCQLDNCPFTINSDQQDDNKNLVGDVCLDQVPGPVWESNTNTTNKQADKDNDMIPDDRDQCPEIGETYNGYKDDDGCPELGTDNICQTNTLTNTINIGECLQCPCQYAAIPSDLNSNDIIRATLRNRSGSLLQGRSDTRTVP